MKYLLITTSLILSFAFSHAQTGSTYLKNLETWHAQRIADLKADDGWLNLVGLYWLEEGKSTFGSGAGNKIVFPKGSIADNAGYFTRSGNTVTVVAANGTAIQVEGQPVKTESIIYATKLLKAPTVTSGSLQWTIIKREDKIGIRLRDLKSPAPAAFTDVERFTPDEKWVIPARLQVPVTPASIAITNVIGQTSRQATAGKLSFTIDSKQYTLDALDEGDELFIVFGDATSGVTTYPSGRFVYAKKPGPDGNTVIDFNKAYNPPCAFTDFATCPLPPSQNILPVEIAAGEKNYGNHTK